MSTDYYKVCDACVTRAVHYHRAEPDQAVAHTWFDGKRLVLDIHNSKFHNSDEPIIDEYGTITTFREIEERCNRGAG